MEGFVQEEEPALTHSDFGSANVFSVVRREGRKTWSSVLYIRKHLVSLEEKLMEEFWKNPEKSIVYVKGSPGCGKTCFFYLWARLRSVNDRQRVLIVQFREKDACYIWIREADGSLWRMDKAIKASKLEETVDEILNKNEEKESPFDLCIHDGVLDQKEICSNMLSTLNTAISNENIKKVIHVTSLAFHLTTGGQVVDSSGDILELSVDSWRLEDYNEAITCEEFANRMVNAQGTKLSHDKEVLENNGDDDGAELDSTEASDEEANKEGVGKYGKVDDDGSSDDGDATDEVPWTDVIETKYYYAGGSARFMFDYQLSELRSQLEKRCARVKDDDWQYFAQGAIASGTPPAVNTLMQQFDEKASPLCKYVLFRAYEICKTSLVRAVKAVATSSNSPALKGWAFELEQIDLIRLSLESPSENREYITNSNGLSFNPHSAIAFDEKKFEHDGAIAENGTVIWCLKWNQGCFDVAFYQDNTLVTLQFTVSEEHSLKPKFIRWLRDALLERSVRVDRVVHVGVGEEEAFQFKTDTSGTGRQGNAEEPQFTIKAFHSLPLEKKTVSPHLVFEANLSSELAEIKMWELATTKKRRRKY